MQHAIRQPDLFPTTADLNAPVPVDAAAMEAQIRPRLAVLLAEALAATCMPWAEERARVNAILFHNMANWLPETEREAMRAAFREQCARLGMPPYQPG